MSTGVVGQLVSISRILLAVAAVLVMVKKGQAADVTWGGNYRFEGVRIANPEMSSDKADKTYVLHHLVLNPKVVAADGLTIFSRLDILNSPTYGINSSGQVNSVAGDILGNGPGTAVSGTGASATGPASGADSNSWGRTERAGTVAVTQLYASWVQEFGQLVVGRAPVHFGLGTALNAGNGLFDHYIDTRDMVAYKVVLGNFSVMPILGKINRGNIGEDGDVNDYIVHAQYANPDSELSLGFLYDVRIALGNDTPNGSGAPTLPSYWGNTATRTGSFRNTLMGFYFSQKALPNLRASVEADLFSGDTGIMYAANGGGTSLNSFGLAAEFAYIPSAESKWGGNFKLGMATGDDPGTTDVYEGFTFSRNYDVAMLMFNHPLGNRNVDFMRTGLTRDTSTRPANQIDSEAISNTMYFAPSFSYQAKDNLSYGATLVYALLNKDPIGGGVRTATDLGYELDFSVTYKPLERLTWITEAGFLLPGDAWRGGTNAYENKFVYGLATKAAISF